jgi:hypothetical protein
MPLQAALKRHLNPSQDERPPLNEPVNVVAEAGAIGGGRCLHVEGYS